MSETELDVALGAVTVAARLATRVQRDLGAADRVLKADASPVTVADLAVQAAVSLLLSRALGPHALIAEEDLESLRSPSAAGLRRAVTDLVRAELGADVTEAATMAAIGRQPDEPAPATFWTLDPIDGTKGFLRGEQYAIALAKIVDGAVTIGVLGCPNLPNPDGTTGATFVAEPGRSVVVTPAGTAPARVATTGSLAAARIVESVESGHTDHDHAARVAELLGVRTEPHRLDSQCKYGAIARGDASIYLRLPTRADYREKIWDHAAGAFVVEQAGGRVTDVDGHALDFTRGRTLERNRGVVATNGEYHDEVVGAVGSALTDDRERLSGPG